MPLLSERSHHHLFADWELVYCKIVRLRKHDLDGSIASVNSISSERFSMKCQDASKDRARTEILVVAVCGLAVAALVASVALVASPRDAAAKPEYASSTGKGCGYCHTNPSGGGALKAAGRKFQANGHKL
jgi:hypothetical protein